LQSFPIPGSDFKYSFHADMEFENMEQFQQVVEDIKPTIVELKIYGVYKNGKAPSNSPKGGELQRHSTKV
jgi:prephenate dehydratase